MSDRIVMRREVAFVKTKAARAGRTYLSVTLKPEPSGTYETAKITGWIGLPEGTQVAIGDVVTFEAGEASRGQGIVFYRQIKVHSFETPGGTVDTRAPQAAPVRQGPPPVVHPPDVNVGPAAIVLMARAAESGLKYPKVRLETKSGIPVVLARAGANAKHPGSVNVSDGEHWRRGRYWGRIHVDGRFEPTRLVVRAIPQEVYELIVAFGKDPVKVGAEARLKGACAFCGKALETPESTTAGYGPVCAKHWKLPWGVRAARKMEAERGGPVVGAGMAARTGATRIAPAANPLSQEDREAVERNARRAAAELAGPDGGLDLDLRPRLDDVGYEEVPEPVAEGNRVDELAQLAGYSVRHGALIRFREEVSEADAQAALEKLAALIEPTSLHEYPADADPGPVWYLP